jgi:surfeit locus 1 family protein
VSARRAIWPVLLASLLGLAVLCSLGIWQVNRLAGKTALIAAIDARMAAEPVPLAEALRRHDAGEDVEYTKVAARGSFLQSAELRKLTTFQGNAAYQLIAPLHTDDGIVIMVDRGAVRATPDIKYRMADHAMAGYVGILRAHDKGQGFFDPENDPVGNQWYWWDIPAMLGAAKVPADAKVSSLVLQLLPDAAESAPPVPAVPKAELRNNHLGYAVTWFGLAAVLVVMTGIFLFRERREASA